MIMATASRCSTIPASFASCRSRTNRRKLGGGPSLLDRPLEGVSERRKYNAGILPVFWDPILEKRVVLLGEERNNRVFADFGGTNEPIDSHRPEATAVREFSEEISLLYEPKHIRGKMTNGLIGKIAMPDYLLYILHFGTIKPELPRYYEDVRSIYDLMARSGTRSFTEKTRLLYVDINSLFHAVAQLPDIGNLDYHPDMKVQSVQVLRVLGPEKRYFVPQDLKLRGAFIRTLKEVIKRHPSLMDELCVKQKGE